MIKKILRNALIAAAAAAPLSASATIIGETIVIDWYFPNDTSVFASSGNVVVSDPGVEWAPGSGLGDIDVGDGIITVENLTSGWSGATFNGFTFTDALGTIADFTSLSLVSIGGFPPPVDPVLSFTADVLSINFNPTGSSNVGDGTGQFYTFAFSTAADVDVPAPATLPLIGLGLLALGLVRRERSAQS